MSSVPQRQRTTSEYSGFDRQPINGHDAPHGGALKAQVAWAQMLPAVGAFTTEKWVMVQHVPRRYPQSTAVLKGPRAGS